MLHGSQVPAESTDRSRSASRSAGWRSRTTFFVAVATLAILCSAARAGGPITLANTTGGSGEFKVRIHTCDKDDARTSNPVYMILQSGGKVVRLPLDNPGLDRRRNTWDEYYFSWGSLAPPEDLESIKIEKHGTDQWCMDAIELYWDEQRFWGWRPWDDWDETVLDFPEGHRLSIDDLLSKGPHPFVRFADESSPRGSGAYTAPDGHFLEVKTCPASYSPNSGTANHIDVHIKHDGVVDIIRIPPGKLKNPGSTYKVRIDRQTRYMRRIEQVRLVNPGGDSWCKQAAAIYGLDGSSTVFRWEQNSRKWISVAKTYNNAADAMP